MGNVLIFLGFLVFAAHLFSMIFSKKKIPDVLWLLVIGLVIGPILHIVKPQDLGKFGPIFSAIVLLVILFESGLDISIRSLKDAWASIVRITFSNFIFSVIIIAALAVNFFGFPLLSGIILGTILGGTSSAVIIPLVKILKLSDKTRTTLILESAITDVLCIVLTIAFVQSYEYNELNALRIAGNIISSFVMAAIIGIIGGIAWSSVLDRIRKIQNPIFLTPAFVFILYGISESMDFSGAISALAFGITISNTEYFKFPFLKKYQKDGMPKLAPIERSFISEISFLFKTFFFVYIGISIPLDNMMSMIYGGIITLSLLIMRFIVTKFTSPGQNSYDKTIISFMIPKGLAAAVLAQLPLQMGMPFGEEIKHITYGVVLISITASSIFILLVERFPRLRVFYRRFWGTKSSGSEETLNPSIEESDDKTNLPGNDESNDEVIGNS